MGFFCLLFIHAQIIFTGSIQPFMTQDFLHVDNRASIEDKIGGHCMAEDVGSEFLVDICELLVPTKEPPNIISIEPGVRFLGNKNRFMSILAPF